MDNDEARQRLAEVLVRHRVPDKRIVSKLPKGGDKDRSTWRSCKQCGGYHAPNAIHLSYVGHADITALLIAEDPLWEWEPIEWEDGSPKVSVINGMATMWGRLKLHGVWRLGVGSCEANKPDQMKELYGDCLRNCAMRFGIAISLWSKSGGGDDTFADPQPVKRQAEKAPSEPRQVREVDLSESSDRTTIMEMIQMLPDTERRKCKAEFYERFGRPDTLKSEFFHDAMALVARYHENAEQTG